MGAVASLKKARMMPNPIGIPPLEFNLYSFGQMKPIPAIPHQITVSLVPQSILDIFIPKNTWGEFKLLQVWADFNLSTSPPNAPGGDTYTESYNLASFPNVFRGPAGVVQNVPATTRYVMQRQFQYEAGGGVYEENWNTVGVTSLFQAQRSDHRIDLTAAVGVFDNTIDNYLSFMLQTNNPASTCVAYVHTAQAFIQSPLDLRRNV